jgi:vancomycin resistance protein VanJ
VDDGPLALAQILTPHIALACLLLIPVAAIARSRGLGIVLVGVAVVFGFRFGSEWWSPPTTAPAGSVELDVATWNLEYGSRAAASSIAMLIAHPADVIALEELTPDVAAAIEADPTLRDRYPSQALFPSDGAAGIGLLSRYPLGASTYASHPARLEAALQLNGGQVIVIAAHPFAAIINRLAGFPVGFDPADRNRGLALLQARMAELVGSGERVLLIGDFNTAPTDPAFARLSAGLQDAHLVAGVGPGWSWRPAPLEFLGMGLLRIDLVLSTSQLQPVRTAIACPRVGDHCLVEATLAVTP